MNPLTPPEPDKKVIFTDDTLYTQIISDSKILSSSSFKKKRKIIFTFGEGINILLSFYNYTYNFNKDQFLHICYFLFILQSGRLFETLVLAKLNEVDILKIEEIDSSLSDKYLNINILREENNEIDFITTLQKYQLQSAVDWYLDNVFWYKKYKLFNTIENKIIYDDITYEPIDRNNFIEIEGRLFNNSTIENLIRKTGKTINPFTRNPFTKEILDKFSHILSRSQAIPYTNRQSSFLPEDEELMNLFDNFDNFDNFANFIHPDYSGENDSNLDDQDGQDEERSSTPDSDLIRILSTIDSQNITVNNSQNIDRLVSLLEFFNANRAVQSVQSINEYSYNQLISPNRLVNSPNRMTTQLSTPRSYNNVYQTSFINSFSNSPIRQPIFNISHYPIETTSPLNFFQQGPLIYNVQNGRNNQNNGNAIRMFNRL